MIRKHLPLLLILSLSCWVVYFNSLKGGFIVDDIPAFRDNPNIKDLGYAFANYNIQTVLYAITYYLFGISTVPQHIASVLLHNTNVILGFFLLLKFTNKKLAFISSLLFALHPVNIESITWMSGRSYLFNALIFFVTANFYFKYFSTKKSIELLEFKKLKTAYITFSIMLVLIGNAWSVLIPVQLLILQIGFFTKDKQKLKLLAPFFLAVGAYSIITLLGGTLSSRQEAISEIATTQSSAINLDALIFSITKSTELLVYPSELTLYHVPTSPIQLIVLTLIVIAVALIVAFKYNKQVFYLLLLVYSSFSISLIPFFMTNKVAERYLYLSSFFISVVWSKVLTHTKLKKAGVVAALIICVFFALKIINRNNDWKDSVTFWQAEIRTNPKNARLYAELGYTYITEVVDYKMAVTYIAKSLELNPNQFFAYHNLGKIYGDVKDYEKASLFFKKALELNSTYYISWYGLAYTEFQQNKKEEALAYINKTLELKPNYTKAQELKKLIEGLKSN